MLAFLGLIEVGRRAPDTAAGLFLALKVALPGLLILFYARRGRFPELRGYRPSLGQLAADVAVGVVGAALWMAPYLLFASLRPEPGEAFDPDQLGPTLVWIALALRATGYALVTPFVEELFVRSWMLRYVDVFDRNIDFRDVPIGQFRWRSFLVVVAYFTLSHMPWEYPVALAWVVGTQLWLYRRKHIGALVVVHAASNLSIFLAVVLASELRGLDWWFFL